MTIRKPAPASDDQGDSGWRERASASPASMGPGATLGRFSLRAHELSVGGPVALQPPANGAPVGLSTQKPMTLAAAQQWFAAAVLDSSSLDDALAPAAGTLDGGAKERAGIGGILRGDFRLSAEGRLAIYHSGYRARLVECLADDYPTVKQALDRIGGDGVFHAVALEYIAAYPSRSPNLNGYGKAMEAFLRSQAAPNGPPRSRRTLVGATARDLPWDFAADLASLEWAIVEAIHAPAGESLSTEHLATVPPDLWGAARLAKSPTVLVRSFAYPANAYFQRVRLEGQAPAPAAAPTSTAVYRLGDRIWRMDLTPAMAGLLRRLFAGETLGGALDSLAVDAEDDAAIAEAEQSVMIWFKEWVLGGFFSAIEL